MNEQQFWNRVNDLLDERLDPHEDREVQRYLAENPGGLAQFERLVARLDQLAQPASSSRSGRRLLIAAAGLLLAATVAYRTLNPAEVPALVEPEEAVASVNPASRPFAQIVHYRLTVTRETEHGSIATRHEDGEVSRVLSSPQLKAPFGSTHLTVARTHRPDRRLP